jgi:hypothetical protein
VRRDVGWEGFKEPGILRHVADGSHAFGAGPVRARGRRIQALGPVLREPFFEDHMDGLWRQNTDPANLRM